VGLAPVAEAEGLAAEGLITYEETTEAYRRALDLYESLGREQDAGRMQVLVGGTVFQLGRHDEVPTWLEPAIARLEQFGDSHDLAYALGYYGNFLRRTGRLAEAEPALRRAVDIASRIGDRVGEGHALNSLGVVLLHLGDVAEGMRLVEESYRVAEDAGDLELTLRCHNALASCLMDYGPDYERGWDVLRRGIELSQRSGRRDFEGWLWTNWGNYAFDQGKLDELDRASEMSAEIGRTLGYWHILAAGHLYRAVALFLRGELDAADRAMKEGYSLEDIRAEVQAAPYVTMAHAGIAWARGDPDGELRWLFEGLEVVGDELMMGMADELLSETVRALVRRGRSDEAEAWLEKLRGVAPGRPNSEAFLWWAEAAVEADPGEARRLLVQAATRFRELGRPLDEGRCLVSLAEMKGGVGEDSTPELERARELFTSYGAAVYLTEIERIEAG
jgi:tetratricopeptide (TPR) repeat protein